MARIKLVESYEVREHRRKTEMRERAKRERRSPTLAERRLQLELNKGYWRFRLKKVQNGELNDLWCSILGIGVQVHPGGTDRGAEFHGSKNVTLHFGEEEVLEELWVVVQVVEAACLSQDALEKARRKMLVSE